MNSHPRLDTFRTVIWSLVGAIVLLGVFFFALGGLEPSEAEVMVIVVGVLAIAWLVHFWRNRSAATDVRLSRGDRERRGF